MFSQIQRLMLCACMGLLAGFVPKAEARSVKVACVGNSITYGAYFQARDREAYPARLGQLLGEGYEVANFGADGASVLRSGDNWPYVTRFADVYHASLAFSPDIVTIKLGTNDARIKNDSLLRTDFRKDYEALIDSYAALPTHPRIVLLTPIASHMGSGGEAVDDGIITRRIVPVIEAVAAERGLEVVNLHNVLGDTYDTTLYFPDRLHPTPAGADRIARRLYAYFTTPRTNDRAVGRLDGLKVVGDTAFHGYASFTYLVDGERVRVVMPRRPAKTQPIALRTALTDNSLPADLRRLEDGYYLVSAPSASRKAGPSACSKVVAALVKAGCSAGTTFDAPRVKVACVGNSITYGANIIDRDANCYPAQLGRFLGADYAVRNFGVSGTTLCHTGNYPYISTGQYEASKAFAPDVVFIKLGTNDSKPGNRDHLAADYVRDYRALISSYNGKAGAPRIILLTPARCFMPEGLQDIDDAVLRRDVTPRVEQLAYEDGLEIINLHALWGSTWRAQLFPDKLHPSAAGATYMARKLCRYLLTPRDTSFHLLAHLTAGGRTVPGASSNYHGFVATQLRLKAGGTAFSVVVPKRPAVGAPWIVRPADDGRAPQLDLALLELGFTIVRVNGAPATDVAGICRAVTRAGLARRCVVENPGGACAALTAWAVKNKGRVAHVETAVPADDPEPATVRILTATGRTFPVPDLPPLKGE